MQIKVPNSDSENPWLKLAGKYKDDPQFEEMMADIESDRRSLNLESLDDQVI